MPCVLLSLALVAGPSVQQARAQESTPAADVKDKAAEEKAVKDGKRAAAPKVVDVKESKEDAGEKSYEFGAVEVEGRLKAPQILYFLRRVRAEFRAGLLGHRSFMPELSDTRRSPALR